MGLDYRMVWGRGNAKRHEENMTCAKDVDLASNGIGYREANVLFLVDRHRDLALVSHSEPCTRESIQPWKHDAMI